MADTNLITSFEGWKALLTELVAGKALSSNVAETVMQDVLEGRAASSQLAALLVCLRQRGETSAELSGFATAMRSAARRVPLSEGLRAKAIDTCGTGGDGSGTINVSTAAAFVAAAAGAVVCKHGNRAASSASGSADVLEALGVTIDLGPQQVATCIEQLGVGFCMAPRFHPAMRHARPTRQELGMPTAFNYLGPLVNPAEVTRQVIGVSSVRYGELMMEVLQLLGATKAMVVHGHDGLDELTTTTSSSILMLANGEVSRFDIDAADYGIKRAKLDDLMGAEPAHNAQRLVAILEGEDHPQADLVAFNAAAALVVADVCPDMKTAVNAARNTLAQGLAGELLARFVKLTGELGAQSEAGEQQ